MAQMKSLLFAALLSVGPAIAAAQPAVPDAALRAESAGAWDEAVQVYRGALEANPRRADLWIRIADVESRRSNSRGVIDALENAVKANSKDASTYVRLSQAYAAAGLATRALHAIESALTLEPDQPEFLRAKAVLATWVGDYQSATDSYRRLTGLVSADDALVLAYARVSAWAGDTDVAVREYERYLAMKPENADVLLELAKTESWRGNYAGAMAALDKYRERFGETDNYSAEVAAILTNAGRPREAEKVLAPLLVSTPDNVSLNVTRTLALAAQHQARDAYESLDTLRRLAPQAHDTEAVEHVLRTLLASTVETPATFYGDSDNLQIQRFAPHATLALRTGTDFSAGYEQVRLRARAGSGLEGVDGSTSATFEQTFAGIAQRVGGVTFRGQAGYATGAGPARNTYDVGVDIHVADTIRVGASRSFAPFVVSPRTVDLGLTASTERVQVDWSPTLVYHVAFDGRYQEISDGNRRWEMTISPTRTVARTAHLNLDLGVSAYRLDTTYDFANGYYDPRRYEYYAAALYPYVKVRENVGLALSISAGAQRDNLSPAFHFGGTVAGEATLGIYRPWAVKFTSSATLNRRLDTGAFRGFGAGVALVRRF
jgi:tetratricopeptide (TPR) repeat protein